MSFIQQFNEKAYLKKINVFVMCINRVFSFIYFFLVKSLSSFKNICRFTKKKVKY